MLTVERKKNKIVFDVRVGDLCDYEGVVHIRVDEHIFRTADGCKVYAIGLLSDCDSSSWLTSMEAEVKPLKGTLTVEDV